MHRLPGLEHLPRLAAPAPLEVFAEVAHAIDEWFLRGWAAQELANPAHAVGGGVLRHETGAKQEVGKLLECGT